MVKNSISPIQNEEHKKKKPFKISQITFWAIIISTIIIYYIYKYPSHTTKSTEQKVPDEYIPILDLSEGVKQDRISPDKAQEIVAVFEDYELVIPNQETIFNSQPDENHDSMQEDNCSPSKCTSNNSIASGSTKSDDSFIQISSNQ